MSDTQNTELFSTWQPPNLQSANAQPPDEQVIAKIKSDAYAEAFAQGKKDGEQAGMALTEQRANTFLDLVNSMDKPLMQMDEKLTTELAKLAAAIAEQIVRVEIENAPDKTIDIVKQVVATLSPTKEQLQLYLNPTDIPIIREHVETLPAEAVARSWKLFEDEALNNGDCRVTTGDSSIDGSLTNQIREIVNAGLSTSPPNHNEP